MYSGRKCNAIQSGMKSSGSVDHGATSELFLLAKKSIAHNNIHKSLDQSVGCNR